MESGNQLEFITAMRDSFIGESFRCTLTCSSNANFLIAMKPLVGTGYVHGDISPAAIQIIDGRGCLSEIDIDRRFKREPRRGRESNIWE